MLDDILNWSEPEAFVSWIYFAAIGVTLAFFLFAMLFLVNKKKDLTILHAVVFGVIAACIALTAQNYLSLFDWVFIGLSGYDLGASLFVAGMLMMVAVMIYNYATTGGKKMVQ